VPVQDDKPYILEVQGYKLFDDPRAQGFNFLARTVFASLEDHGYYDTECEAHKNLKLNLGNRIEDGGIMSVYGVA